MTQTTPHSEQSAATACPTHLRISEGFVDPIGFYDATPMFSWRLPDNASTAQSAYRIVVASNPEQLVEQPDLWDSGRVESDQSAWVPYRGAVLVSRQRVFWQVTLWDEAGNELDWSAPSCFELGLLNNEAWSGQWIGLERPIETPSPAEGGESDDKSTPPVFIPEYLRREFSLTDELVQARLYVTAKGLFDVHLNGAQVGEDLMTPGWTPYHKRIETLTYDVTELISEGDNAIGVILGEGWYAGIMMGKQFKYPEAQPALLLQLELTFRDGRTQSVVTDTAWKGSNAGPIRFSGIYDGENYDAGMEMQDWDRTGFDDSAWSAVLAAPVDASVPLVPKRHNPVRVTETLEPIAITEPEPGRFVFDLGQNMVGRAKVTIPVEAGQTVTLRFAEMLQQDGTLYTENYRTAKSTDTYRAACNGTVSWMPTFTFHGFRYVELSGLPEAARPEPSWVVGQVMHSNFARRGSFVSSHAKLNQLQSNITWGQRGNFLEIPTDCPQRNERLGWTGDAQVFCPTSVFNYDVHAFWMSWLQSVREEQGENGYIPNVVPNTLDDGGSPGWGDVGVTAPWDIYVRTGDRRVLSDNYDMMKRWLGAYENEAQDFIVDRKGFGDWLQPMSTYRDGETPKDLIATAYFGRCTLIVRKVAALLGNDEDATRYAAQFDSIVRAFSAKYFDDSGKLTTEIETQTGYLMALGYDLLMPELREGATSNLLRLIKEADGHLRTGFLGTPLINSVLDRTGHVEVAFEVLFKETYPSWFFSINQGATTMWERWNSYSHAEGFGDAGMNSFNHYAYGAISEWMVERIAGLAPDPEQPGYKHFFVQPLPGGPLTSAAAELDTAYGQARCAWSIEDGKLLIQATVPMNASATLIVPEMAEPDSLTIAATGAPCETTDGEGRRLHHLSPGHHAFALRTA